MKIEAEYLYIIQQQTNFCKYSFQSLVKKAFKTSLLQTDPKQSAWND